MIQRSGLARPGGRTARTRELVHAAVREILGETDAAAPTITEVAVRSGVNPVTIYRRWGTVEGLILDVAVDDANQHSPLGVTGDLRADLLAWGHDLERDVSRPEGMRLFRAIIAAASATPAADDTGLDHLQHLVQPRLNEFRRMLDASGTEELSPADIVDLLLAPVYVTVLFTPSGRTAHTIDIARLVDNVLAVRDRRRAAGP